MNAGQSAANLRVYDAPEVAAHYASLDYLTACEQLLFSSYIPPGSAVLDVGVGGGRTTPYLSGRACRYIGVDYSETMIRNCRARFPGLEFLVMDASDLSAFADNSFDAVVMAFNALDYVIPAERRWRCLRECGRVLRSGGMLIFSSHNPRAILERADWDRARLRAFAQEFISEDKALFAPFFFAVTLAKAVHSGLRAAGTSLVRTIRGVGKPAFWSGEGDLFDSSHGGLFTHSWIPDRVVAELDRFGFQLVKCVGEDYPRASHVLVTRWYYYVFQK